MLSSLLFVSERLWTRRGDGRSVLSLKKKRLGHHSLSQKDPDNDKNKHTNKNFKYFLQSLSALQKAATFLLMSK